MQNALGHNRAGAAAAALIALLGLPALGVADEEWRQNLMDQAEAVEDCVVASVGNVVQSEEQDQYELSATVDCKDGRAFEASQSDEFLPFSFTECEGGASGC